MKLLLAIPAFIIVMSLSTGFGYGVIPGVIAGIFLYLAESGGEDNV